MKCSMNKNEVYILSSKGCLNFNKIENQKLAQKVNIPFELLNQKEYIRIILQWYIYVRNNGCVFYRDKIYNLNLSEDANEMLSLLENENFLKIIDTNTVQIIDPDFYYIDVIRIPFLWINLLHKKLIECSDEQINKYNADYVQLEVGEGE